MKKTDIYSLVIAVACLLILTLGLDLNIIFSIIIAIIFGVSFAMVLGDPTQKKKEVPLDSQKAEDEKMYAEARATIKKIKMFEDKIENINIKANIKNICDTSNKILNALKENPKKVPQVKKFVEYYLPFTLNILNQYNTVEDQRLTSKESGEFMKKVEKTLQRVEDACDTQLNNMYETDLMNTNADIKVFETMLKTDGLVDDNMNVIKLENK